MAVNSHGALSLGGIAAQIPIVLSQAQNLQTLKMWSKSAHMLLSYHTRVQKYDNQTNSVAYCCPLLAMNAE